MLKKYLIELISFFITRSFRIHLNYISKKYYLERVSSERRPKLMFGTIPIISNKYYSNALKEVGYDSKTIMSGVYAIHKKEDFDLYFDDVIKQSNFKFKYFCTQYIIFSYILKNFDVIHVSFNGLNFTDKWIKENEINLIKKFGCKIIVLPYGYDFYQYSKVPNISWRHVMQVNYPESAFQEEQISKNIKKYISKADVIVSGFQTEGLGRWDIFPYSMVNIDLNICNYNHNRYNQHNGKNEVVKIAHSPNHRYIKGTEYLINAVNVLKSEGLLIELLLLEKKPNREVLEILSIEADILVEQLVLGYALSAIEGMASGLTVLSNLSEETQTRAFRRYSYLNECPIVTTTPENIIDNLRVLILNPNLRKEIGQASRKYVEKYHSNKSVQYMYGKIYDKIWYKKKIDLMNLYHPLNPESYNNQSPRIEHPLIENKLPDSYFNKNN